jgi:hypothetical protein
MTEWKNGYLLGVRRFGRTLFSKLKTMEEKEQKNEVAQQPSMGIMSNEALMQMMKHLWPDTNEQKGQGVLA